MRSSRADAAALSWKAEGGRYAHPFPERDVCGRDRAAAIAAEVAMLRVHGGRVDKVAFTAVEDLAEVTSTEVKGEAASMALEGVAKLTSESGRVLGRGRDHCGTRSWRAAPSRLSSATR